MAGFESDMGMVASWEIEGVDGHRILRAIGFRV